MRAHPNVRVRPFLYAGGDEGRADGAYRIPGDKGIIMNVIANEAFDGWEHVSVSLPHRCPTWGEMDKVRRLFWRDDETVMQLHVPVAENISFHAYCLHLWRPTEVAIPRPPSYMVGPAPVAGV